MVETDLKAIEQHVSQLRIDGKYKEAIEQAFDLLELARERHDYKAMLTAHAIQAASYYCIGCIEEAFENMDHYYDICQDHGDDYAYINMYNTQFLLFEQTKNYQKAKKTLKQSIALSTQMKRFNIASNAYSNFSHLYLEEKKYDQALEMATKGVELAKRHQPETPILLIRVQLNMAKAYIGLSHFKEAKVIIDKILESPVLDQFTREKSQGLDLLGAWYKQQGHYQAAYDTYTQAKELVETYNDVVLLKSIQEERMTLCELLEDVTTGYAVQKEYIQVINEMNARDLAQAALKLEVKHSTKAIEKKANIDYLTGVYNRNYLEETVDQWLSEEADSHCILTCLALDIDNFKAMNDTYGHLFGDEVIQLLSQACLDVVRKDDIVGRYGGDEFVIILKGTMSNTGKKKAEQLKAVLKERPLTQQNVIIPVEISIGVTDTVISEATTFKSLFKSADIALYEAKRNGKNQVCVTG